MLVIGLRLSSFQNVHELLQTNFNCKMILFPFPDGKITISPAFITSPHCCWEKISNNLCDGCNILVYSKPSSDKTMGQIVKLLEG
jgi:hypothetical protein